MEKKCAYCGAIFETENVFVRLCRDCTSATRTGKAYRPPRHIGNNRTDGWYDKCESEQKINVILAENRPSERESPFDYGKIMARLSKRR